MPEVHRPSHMMPSAYLQPHDYRPDLDPTISETLSSSNSDDRATLADLMVKNESNLLKTTNTKGSKRKLEITHLDHLDHAYVVVLARCSEVR